MKDQENEKKKQLIIGLVNILIGVSLILISLHRGGTDLEDFIGGVLMAAGCGDALVGVYVAARTFRK